MKNILFSKSKIVGRSVFSRVVISTAVSLLLLTGCSPESQTVGVEPIRPESKVDIPKYDPIPEQTFSWITEDGGESSQSFNPQIDILFVIDNSDSMVSAQANLKRNIDKFTASIIKNKMIDYHIGVVSAWDSSERAAKLNKEGYSIGELRHIKDASGKKYDKRYLDRSTEDKNLMASTIHIGITPFNQGGPEVEELFSPLQAALEKSGHGQVNEGFFRDQAQLVIVLLTDADDSTNRISPEQMMQTLVDFKQGRADKISVYGALVSEKDPDQFKDWGLRIHPTYHPECFTTVGKTHKNNGTCTGFGPKVLEQFIAIANNQAGKSAKDLKNYIMSIRQDFGQDLTRIGQDITVKTLTKVINLQQRPRVNSTTRQLELQVRYGSPKELQAGRQFGQKIPAGEKGWLYNPEDNSIRLSGHIQYKYVEGGRFAVDMIPVTLKQ